MFALLVSTNDGKTWRIIEFADNRNDLEKSKKEDPFLSDKEKLLHQTFGDPADIKYKIVKVESKQED
ncbi:MAG: hypothetical protein AAB340_03475 [Patescibacteria group bacterium]|mgnify:CR=1 FL=1